MLKLSKKVEYALIAIRHMAIQGSSSVITAKIIAEKYFLSFELLSKVLQLLVRNKIISSHQGMHGGYTLILKPEEISLLNIIHVIDGKTPGIVQCLESGDSICSIQESCTIKSPLLKIQNNLEETFFR